MPTARSLPPIGPVTYRGSTVITAPIERNAVSVAAKTATNL